MTRNKINDMATNFAMFMTFFTIAWVIYLFPDIIFNFYPSIFAKILLAISFSSLTLFDDKSEDSNGVWGDFGVGVGALVIFIGFIHSSHWLIRIISWVVGFL